MTTIELERPRVTEVEALRRRLAAVAPAVVARLPRLVLLAWAVFVFAVIAFEPAPNADAVVPLWANVTIAAFWLTLLGGAGLAWLGLVPAALRASAFAGSLGILLGYSCHASAHHLGAWWLVETGACAAIGLASAVALVARRR